MDHSSGGIPNNPTYPTSPKPVGLSKDVQPPSLKSILRERQFARNRKACLPCRERKVRCNHEQPCQTCLKRGHADLCFYDQPPSTSPSRQLSQAEPDAVTDARSDRSDGQSSERPSSRDHGVSNASPSLLGVNSIISVARPDVARPQTDNERRTAFETGILPLLGMDAASDGGHGAQAGDSTILDQEMITLFSFYRDRIHPFQFVVDDLSEIEQVVCSLISREIHVKQVDNHSLCLLHAILAAGAQFSDLPTAARVSKSRQELHCALGYLGSFDLLWNPSKRLIQALLILGHVLQNDMNPRAAWILGGTTVRLALSIGLHQPQKRYALRLSPTEAQHLRLAIVWQDALLSLAFDRPPASQEMDLESDLPALTSQPLDYHLAMNWLCHLTSRHLPRSSETAPLRNYRGVFQDFDHYEASLAPHLRDRQRCGSILELQEHYSLALHRNFGLSALCRPILSSQIRQRFSEEDYSTVLDRFRSALKKCVSAFIKLRSMSNLATRSWAFVHNGLSSALLLSFIRQGSESDDVRQIQAELVKTLTERSEDVGQFSVAHKKALMAIQALRRISEQENTVEAEGSSDEPMVTDSGNVAQEMNNLQDQSMVSLDEWLRDFDFDAFFPLESYNLIMSDQVPYDSGL